MCTARTQIAHALLSNSHSGTRDVTRTVLVIVWCKHILFNTHLLYRSQVVANWLQGRPVEVRGPIPFVCCVLSHHPCLLHWPASKSFFASIMAGADAEMAANATTPDVNADIIVEFNNGNWWMMPRELSSPIVEQWRSGATEVSFI